MMALLQPERSQVLNAVNRLAVHPARLHLLNQPKALKAFLMISFPSETPDESVPPDSPQSAELTTSELEQETSAMEFLDQLAKEQRTSLRAALREIHPDCLMLLP